MSRRATLRMTAILVALVGLVFIGQGFGLIRNRSFMVDDVRWAVIGAVMVVGSLAFAAWDRTRRR
jgi:drug/metabolite transporter (DMT)-like permease